MRTTAYIATTVVFPVFATTLAGLFTAGGLSGALYGAGIGCIVTGVWHTIRPPRRNA